MRRFIIAAFWMALQLGVIGLVIWSDQATGWARGGSKFALGVIAIFCAWMVTAIPFAVIDIYQRLRAWRNRRRQCQKPAEHSRLRRISPDLIWRGSGRLSGR